MESFFKALKRELINDGRCRSKDEARQEVFKYIELYCNRQRLHSENGHMAPCDLERDAARRCLNNCPENLDHSNN